LEEIRKRFHEGLVSVTDDVVRLGRMLERAVPRGAHVVLEGDLEEGARLVVGDDEFDAMALSIEERTYDLLARQAPVARDLRELVTALRMASELERAADLVGNLVKATRRLYGVTLPPRLRSFIEQLSAEATRLIGLAMDAYEQRSAGLASALDDIDDTLDQLHADYIEAIFDAHASGDVDPEHAMQLALIGRFFERIGDHAVNIGERVGFMVTGLMPDHEPA
jgi:phosphate transport system protein